MTQKQRRLMKKWRRGVTICSLNREEQEVLLLLVDLGYCESRCDLGGDGYYVTSQFGLAEIADKRIEAVRYWITTAIALAAFVKAFF